MLFICYSNLNIDYFSRNGIHILQLKFSFRERVFNSKQIEICFKSTF